MTVAYAALVPTTDLGVKAAVSGAYGSASKELVNDYGMTLSVCREGFLGLSMPLTDFVCLINASCPVQVDGT